MIRGDVHAITLPPRRGRVQHARRYAVAVQADELLALSTIVVSATSRSTPAASFHPEVAIEDESTRVMCEMVGAVDALALAGKIRHLTIDEMRSVDEPLELILGLHSH